MKFILNIFFCLFVACLTKAQNINILDFKPNPMDLSASTHPRFDGNNDAGALVKVLFAEPNVKFEGNIIGVPEFKTNEYWVYLTQGTKLFVIKVPNAIPVQVSFIDHDLSPAQSKTTYELVLSRNGQKKQMLTVSFSPSNASVIIDGKMYPSNNGKVTGLFPVGRHEVMIAAVGYESYEGTVTLRVSSPGNIQTTLIKSEYVDNTSVTHNDIASYENDDANTGSPTDYNLDSANSQYILDKATKDKHFDAIDDLVNKISSLYGIRIGVTTIKDAENLLGKKATKEGEIKCKDGTEFKANNKGYVTTISIDPRKTNKIFPNIGNLNWKSSYEEWNDWFVSQGYEYKEYKPFFAELTTLIHIGDDFQLILMFDGGKDKIDSCHSIILNEWK